MNNTYDIIMNALGYLIIIMTDIIYSYYQTSLALPDRFSRFSLCGREHTKKNGKKRSGNARLLPNGRLYYNYIYKRPTKNHTGSRSRKKLESTAIIDSLLQLDSHRH